MTVEQRKGARGTPRWQRRMPTRRGSIGQSVFSVVMGIAWLVVIAPLILEGGSSGWRITLVIAVLVGWLCFAAAFAAGAVAQRREEAVAR
ncbi:hypothetical protein [uncultured Pseudokineococcus sp.]|uniref:hypothetical protein n=1 Tax=uncultured Pseudokineococcus sp. TaxID=1642928 RepID=UPI00261C69A6|nr:hypothetical protein [uncultured Pseudokineococcus sp.]